MIDPVKLKKCRMQIDSTLKQFCKRAGVKEDTWKSYEAGRRHPSVQKALGYLNGYKVEGFEFKRLKPFTEDDIISTE